MQSNFAGHPTVEQLREQNLVENVYALFRLQRHIEEHRDLSFLINILDRILRKPLHLTPALTTDVMNKLISKRSYRYAIEVYIHRPGDADLADDAVMNALNQFHLRANFADEGVMLLCEVLKRGQIPIDASLVNTYIQKCFEYGDSSSLQRLGVFLADRMKIGAGGATDFGIPGFGDDDFNRILAGCLERHYYEAAGRIALAALKKGWQRVSETLILRQILEPYYYETVGELSNGDVYKPLEYPPEADRHPYGKLLTLLADAMEVIPSIDQDYVDFLYQTRRPAGIIEQVEASYMHLIFVPLLRRHAASIKNDTLAMWVGMLSRSGCGYQAGLLAAAGVELGKVGRMDFDDWMNRIGDAGMVPLLSAVMRKGLFVDAQRVAMHLGRNTYPGLATEAAAAGLQAGFTFETADLERWIQSCEGRNRIVQTAGIHLLKTALDCQVALSPEFIARVAGECTKNMMPWLAVDAALAARSHGIPVDDAGYQAWREACFTGETSDDTVKHMVALIDVYRARAEFTQPADLTAQVNRIFDRLVQQKDALGITDATPPEEVITKIREIASAD
jgi:hypothetical protein